MKIGEFAKKYNIPISSVRHYINSGILMPERMGKQFNFRKQDMEDMQMINMLKDAGFSLKEINTYINTIRVYEPRDNSKYIKLISLLREKELNLLNQKQFLDNQLHLVTALISDYTKKYTTEKSDRSYGLPIDFLDYLACPKCGGELRLDKASISHSRIYSGILGCACGYTSHIDNGLLFTDINKNLDKDPQFFDDYWGDDMSADYDSSFFESINNSTPEFMSLQYKAREWLNNNIVKHNLHGELILLPDVSSHFAYLYHDKSYFKQSLIIITVPSKNAALNICKHMHEFDTTLKIAIVVSPDCDLPFKNSCIDMVIDYLGFYSYSFYKPKPYISYISLYLSENASVIGSLDYFNRDSKSRKTISDTYPNSLSPFPDYKRFKKILSDENFNIKDDELIGSCISSGEYFEYHLKGEPRYVHTYLAQRTSSEF